MSIKIRLIMYIGLLVASQAVYASFWVPATNKEASSIKFTSSVQNAEMGIFTADSNNLASQQPLATFLGGSTVTFANNGQKWTINIDGKPANQIDSNRFQLAWLANGVWISDISREVSSTTPNLWELTFLDVKHGNTVETISVSNIEPVPTTNIATSSYMVSTVPLSATVWAFLSGLIGLLALNKRRVVKDAS